MTEPTRKGQIERKWHLVDAKGQVLGRLATRVSQLLAGKSKPYFSPNIDCGDYVVVVNSSAVTITGKKGKEKVYRAYSGYPGGLRSISYARLMEKNPGQIITHAVSGMLPKNKLRPRWLKKLFVFSGSDHDYIDKFTKVEDKKVVSKKVVKLNKVKKI